MRLASAAAEVTVKRRPWVVGLPSVRYADYAANFVKALRAETGARTAARCNAGCGDPAAETIDVCAVIRNMAASRFGRCTDGAPGRCAANRRTRPTRNRAGGRASLRQELRQALVFS